LLVESSETPVNTATINATETPLPTETTTQVPPTIEDVSTTRLLVRIARHARLENVMGQMSEYGKVRENDELGTLGILVIDVPTNRRDEKMSELENVSGVAWVEPDYPIQALETIPNDPSFPDQYALSAIHASQGWDISTGSSAITIAILDSGIDLTHPDLVNKLVPGFNTIDSNKPPQDDYGHGTHVAGIAAASTNNAIGIAGVSWGARLMPVKVLNSSGGGTFSNVAAGIVWATDHGAQIINMSLGGSSYSQTLQAAVAYSANHGVLLIAASGNSNSNSVLYPARFPQVMAVAATDGSNQRAAFSNYGPEIEIAAPGALILSTSPGGVYSLQSGTSMATPYVSGLAAVLFGYENNASLVREHLKQSALDIPPAGFDIYTGAGLIQMDAALRLILPTPTVLPTLIVPTTAVQGPIFVPPVFSAPTVMGTQTAFATVSAVPATSVTSVPSTSSATQIPVESSTANPSQEIDTETTPEIEALGNRYDFWSPLFCGGILCILLGMIILFSIRKRHVRHL
jgi:subtilisin family serine protease